MALQVLVTFASTWDVASTYDIASTYTVASTYDVVSTYDVASKTLFSGKGFVFFLGAPPPPNQPTLPSRET